jgi:ABC-2 type transport system permease protein
MIRPEVIRAAVTVEWLKLRRSPTAWTTSAVLGLGVPALTAGFMAAATTGPPDSSLAIKVSAMLIGAGWAAYLGMLGQIASVTMLLGVGIVVAWSFGREFAEHTISSLFALPTSRATIAAAKFLVLLGWSAVLCGVVLITAIALAPLAGLPFPDAAAVRWAVKVLIIGLSGAVLALPLAFIASAARGYLPAVGGLILIVVVTQILTVVGVGRWFPYAIPSLWAGMGGQAQAALIQPQQLLLVPLLGAIAIAATTWWWKRAQIA